MKIYSFENGKIGQDGLYDLFKKTVVNRVDIDVSPFVITDEFDGRLDLVCKYLYGSNEFMEELMAMNGIINPHSIKTGDEIFYTESNKLKQLYHKDEEDDSNKSDILNINKDKTTSSDPNRKNYPPSIKPANMKQITVNHNKKKITVTNKLK
jgi:hypothetical protein